MSGITDNPSPLQFASHTVDGGSPDAYDIRVPCGKFEIWDAFSFRCSMDNGSVLDRHMDPCRRRIRMAAGPIRGLGLNRVPAVSPCGCAPARIPRDHARRGEGSSVRRSFGARLPGWDGASRLLAGDRHNRLPLRDMSLRYRLEPSFRRVLIAHNKNSTYPGPGSTAESSCRQVCPKVRFWIPSKPTSPRTSGLPFRLDDKVYPGMVPLLPVPSEARLFVCEAVQHTAGTLQGEAMPCSGDVK